MTNTGNSVYIRGLELLLKVTLKVTMSTKSKSFPKSFLAVKFALHDVASCYLGESPAILCMLKGSDFLKLSCTETFLDGNFGIGF